MIGSLRGGLCRRSTLKVPIAKLSRVGEQSVAAGFTPLQVLWSIKNCFAIMATKSETQTIWRSADAVCFDVDSTVVQEEGIDELAKFCGKGDEVSRLTREAMKGNSDFRDALRIRLGIINPTQDQLHEFVRLQPATLTPGIHELVRLLRQRGTAVYLVSGGISTVIAPVAAQLNIAMSDVFANKLNFDDDGRYVDFDLSQPTSRSGGKGEAIIKLKNAHGYEKLVMIGDGATDLEACPPADAFIGFGGNVIRDTVKSKTKWFVTSFDELIDELY